MPISHRHQPNIYPEYISPLPADELIKVGIMKQDLYSKGVEKVQSQIDTLDQYGFSLVKDVDKQYFSQEMDKFLKAVNDGSAKTDFSNINNLRNLLSIGKPLENNPLILNAIESSKELQRRQEILKSMKPELRSAANDDYFMEDAENWYNDGQVGSKLASGKAYIPYTDINAKIAEKLKILKPDVEKYLSSRGGGLLDIVTIERLTDKKIAEAVQSDLDEKERMQLRLDAKYSLKTMGPENIQAIALKDFQERLDQANKGLVTKGQELDKYRLMYQTSPTAYNKALVDQAEQDLLGLSISKESAEENINKFSDVTQIDLNTYLPYYMGNYITSKSRAYSYAKVEHDYKPDELYIKNLEINAAAARDYQKFLYDRELKGYEAELKGAKRIPGVGIVPMNNDPTKDISGGNVTASISTKGGVVGQKLAQIDKNIEFLGKLVTPKKDSKTGELVYPIDNKGVTENLIKFRDELTQATKQRGTKQLEAIAKVYRSWLGDFSKGSQYTQDVWDLMYTMVSGEPASVVKPEVVYSYVMNSIVNPLQEVQKGLNSSKETRIAINNSLNYDKSYLNGLDFLSPKNFSIFTDDNIVLGTPVYGIDPSTGRATPKIGTREELERATNP